MNSPKEVPFGQLAEVLSQKLKSVVGRGLTDDNKRFLARKAFRRSDIDNYESLSLSWDLFCRRVLPEHDFTFWEWFYNISKFVVKYLADFWKDGLIVGFISRQDAEAILAESCSGTFLLRFSDSCKLGAISASLVSNTRRVLPLQPFASKELKLEGLANSLRDLQMRGRQSGEVQTLKYLYPNIPKDEAFGKYYTSGEQKSTNGYIVLKTETVAQVEEVVYNTEVNINIDSNVLMEGDPDDLLLNAENFRYLQEMLFCDYQAHSNGNQSSEQNEWYEEFMDFFGLENEELNDTV